MRHFDVETLTAGTWRNGGGATREIVSRPAGSGELGWRASIADIDRDGPFSAFPGVDRTLTLLAGDGLWLSCPGEFERMPVQAAEPFTFSGDLALTAELPHGPCRVLNLMVGRGRWTARVDRVTSPVAPPSAHAGMFHVLRGHWQAGDDGPVLASGQGLWWDTDDDASGRRLTPLSPDAEALWADVAPGR
ncbi:HutD family protein [Streptomyces sp. NPDC007355]|uniref:HutD/Ves family protein n=1 Tax=Streptomyces sp. NPDC007355 TaxID=3364778 RepID=UPI0036A70233